MPRHEHAVLVMEAIAERISNGWTGTGAELWDALGGVDGVSRDVFLAVMRAKRSWGQRQHELGLGWSEEKRQARYVYTIKVEPREERSRFTVLRDGGLDLAPTEPHTAKRPVHDVLHGLPDGWTGTADQMWAQAGHHSPTLTGAVFVDWIKRISTRHLTDEMVIVERTGRRGGPYSYTVRHRPDRHTIIGDAGLELDESAPRPR